MRWRSATSPTGCGAARHSCNPGRGRSGNYPRAERLELQQLLAQRGFYRGTPDGQLGGQTRDALRSFQASIGAAADGFASSDVLERLRGH